MRDLLGNRLDKGHIVHWTIDQGFRERGILATVVDVIDSNLRTEDGRPLRPPAIVLQITIPLAGTEHLPPGTEPQLQSMVRVVDPASEHVLDRLAVVPPSPKASARKQ